MVVISISTKRTTDRAPEAGLLPSTMMEVPLCIGGIFRHAMRSYPRREIVWRERDGRVLRSCYAAFGERVARLAHALTACGVRPGDRVASLAWNTPRHLELYYAVPMIGAVLHTINARLPAERICRLLERAEDCALFLDASFAPSLGELPRCVRSVVVMDQAYEDFLAPHPSRFVAPEIDERAGAMLCYTSATTGEPKGVLLSHRAIVLHALSAAHADALDVRERDVVLPLVPMFHVTAWGVPFLAPLVGAKMVLPGEGWTPADALALIESERVTVGLGVPTVWLDVLDEVRRRGDVRLSSLDHVVTGGSAMPPEMRDGLQALGVEVVQAWGMTEMSPTGTVNGRFVPLVAGKIVGEDGGEVARDGVTRGELWVRGPTVAARYYGEESDGAAFADGWFATGDVGTIDEHGSVRIIDRARDLIKSGGEWIASVELESVLARHPGVREVAVIAARHPRWIERPVACVTPRAEDPPAEAALRAWMRERVPRWQVPDRFVLLDALPRTGVGKIDKRALRARFETLLLDDRSETQGDAVDAVP